MKIRNILLALAAVVVVPATAQAQAGGPGACANVAACVMNVTGTVAAEATASVVSTINFNALGTVAKDAVGQFQVVTNFEFNAAVVVSNLVHATESASIISVTSACSYGGTDYGVGGTAMAASCGSTTIAKGTHPIWVQATASAPTGMTAGTYNGTATMTISASGT